MEVPPNEWFIMDNPSKNGSFGGTPIFGNPHVTFFLAIRYRFVIFNQRVLELSGLKKRDFRQIMDLNGFNGFKQQRYGDTDKTMVDGSFIGFSEKL